MRPYPEDTPENDADHLLTTIAWDVITGERADEFKTFGEQAEELKRIRRRENNERLVKYARRLVKQA